MLQNRLQRAVNGSILETQPGYRTAIGVMGVTMPLILMAASLLGFLKTRALENSISAYYWTGIGDWFVGTLFVIGVFLFFYKYSPFDDDRPRSQFAAVRAGHADAWLGKLAGVTALLVALFPTYQSVPTLPPIIGKIHGGAAAILFLCLSLFPLLLFSQSRARERVQQAYGWSMLVVLLAIVAYQFGPEHVRQATAWLKPVLIMETILIMLFGVSWFDKGRELAAKTEAGARR
jgi:uncharacterized membrane protein